MTKSDAWSSNVGVPCRESETAVIITNATTVKPTIATLPYGETAYHGADVTMQSLRHTRAKCINNANTSNMLTTTVLGPL